MEGSVDTNVGLEAVEKEDFPLPRMEPKFGQ
jgi:hypothetical protein